MKESELIEKIMEKKEFSELPKKDVERIFEKFDKDEFSDEEKVKLSRNVLRKIFSGFGGRKILSWKDKTEDEILKKHLSTRERLESYSEVYSRILVNIPEKISVVDLGCGVNGASYGFFEKCNKKAKYFGVEAVGQISNLVNSFFKKEKIPGQVFHFSLLDIKKVKEVISKAGKPRIVFLFKVIDSLETFEKDFTKKLLKEIVPLSDRIVISFATESWMRRKKFFANRKWLIDFIRESWQFTDDFTVDGERYLVFSKD